MFLLTGSFVLIPFIVSIVRHGIGFAVIFLVDVVLISCLVVVLTAFVYLFILRFFSGEKLKDMINYVQIILSLAVMIGYQLVASSHLNSLILILPILLHGGICCFRHLV